MVRRIRFIYRKSYSKFGNDPVHLWKVLEGSRKVRKKGTMEGGVPEGLHNHGRPNPRGGSPRWTPPVVAGHPPPRKGGSPTLSRTPSLGRFPTKGRFSFGVLFEDLGSNSWGFHLYNEGQGEGAGHPKTTSWPHHLAGAPNPSISPNPSRLLLHRNSRIRLGEALPEFSTTTATTPSCCRDSEEDLLLPLPAGTGRRTSSSSTPNIMASPSINFNQFLEKEKLKSNGSNFTDWFRHVRIFLNGGNLQYVLEAPLGSPPPPAVCEEEKNVFETRTKVYSQVQCAILCSLEAELQKRFEHHDPCEMIRELKVIFETHAAVESYEASKQFFGCMMEEGSSVSEHVFAMSGHARKLSDLGIVIPNQLGIHRVLQSLPPSYKNFVMNYNMQNMNKELPELFSMLKSAEVEIQKEHQVLMVNKTTKFKKQGKPKKDLKKGGKKAAAHPEKPKGGPKPDTDCYYCNGKGHWKRNCSKYLADLKSGLVKKKKGISDIHVIDVYLTGSRTSELRNKRSLARDEVTMRVGNGSKVDVIAVGTLPLHLPSGLVLDLNNCYLVPALSMNIIFGSCLMQDGYSFKSENNGCSIFMNNIFYGHAPEKNVWGCEAYVKKLQPDKLEPKAEKCVFIGYPKETIGYTFYHRSEGKIFVAKNGTFLEKEFLTKESSAAENVHAAHATEEANDNDHETSSEVA
ncbi:hypothetical protein QYE76_024865 [Lolium multiflorum]|uniref:CCHC-type domain-containing protein n=1 Tax=Lolium multiflorum TaxID=4521 RepID=A0AAD8RHH1_LOLMU|nr:hypothetical protein QYE76_024865 [Lolium multiflorum]